MRLYEPFFINVLTQQRGSIREAANLFPIQWLPLSSQTCFLQVTYAALHHSTLTRARDDHVHKSCSLCIFQDVISASIPKANIHCSIVVSCSSVAPLFYKLDTVLALCTKNA